jgi:small-conductance mechanosensitive channel
MQDWIVFIKENWFENSYLTMIGALVVIFVTIAVRFLFIRAFHKFIRIRTNELHNDPTNYKFLSHAISALIYIVGFSVAIYMIPSIRIFANSLLAGAGILTVAIGFASQQAFSNIVSGIFIVLFKPFRVNDMIELQDTTRGMVEDITLRHTIIRNFENRRVVIPNAVISQESLINSDLIETKICKIMDFGVSYAANMDRVRSIIQEEALKHPFYVDNRTPDQVKANEHPVTVRMINWADSSIIVRAWIWVKDAPSSFILGCDLYESVKKRFDAEGIEIPFPQRVVTMRKEEG